MSWSCCLFADRCQLVVQGVPSLPRPSSPMRPARFFLATIAGFAPFALSFEAKAAPPSCANTPFTITQLINLGAGGCSIQDKLYSDFSFTGLNTGFFGFTVSGADHTFSGSSLNFTGSSFSYSYKVSLYNASPGQEFLKFNGDATGSSTASGLGFTKTLAVTALGLTSTATEVAPGNIVSFPAGTVGPVTFTGSVTRTGGKIDTMTDTLSQKNADNVPSPLPILGAGVAFASSRRLRRRIKSAV